MKKKKNIIITAVMIVLIAIIAIILVKINSSNVKNKEAKGISRVQRHLRQKLILRLRMTTLQTNQVLRSLRYLVLTAAQISLIKEHVPIPLW